MMNSSQNGVHPAGNYPPGLPGQQVPQGAGSFAQNGMPVPTQFPGAKAMPGDSSAPMYNPFGPGGHPGAFNSSMIGVSQSSGMPPSSMMMPPMSGMQSMQGMTQAAPQAQRMMASAAVAPVSGIPPTSTMPPASGISQGSSMPPRPSGPPTSGTPTPGVQPLQGIPSMSGAPGMVSLPNTSMPPSTAAATGMPPSSMMIPPMSGMQPGQGMTQIAGVPSAQRMMTSAAVAPISGMPPTSSTIAQGSNIPPRPSGPPSSGMPTPGMQPLQGTAPVPGAPAMMSMPNTSMPSSTTSTTASTGMMLAPGMPPTPGMMSTAGMPPAPGMPPLPGMMSTPGMMLAPGMMGTAGMPPTPGMMNTAGMAPTPGMMSTAGMAPTPGMMSTAGMPPTPGMMSAAGMPPAPGMPSGSGMMSAPGMMIAPGMGPPQAMMGTAGMPPAPGMPLGPGMMSAPGMPPAKRGLSLDSMPSAVQVIEEDRSTRSGLFPTGYPNAEHPPLCTTDFFAQDQGNCNPKFMRSTLYVAPASSDVLKNTQIPFAVAVSPFATLTPQELRPPIIDLGEMGPIRCARCKAYMCAFMEFQDGGRRFKCPYCLAATKVEDGYFAHLDPSGRRSDIQHRPEQFLGSYEFVATKPYCKNGVKPKEPAFIFMLDVSYTAVHSGLVSTFCKNIRGLLEKLPKDAHEEKSSIRIGFVTYDQTIHFYNLKNPLGQPKMTVVSDMQEVFTPLVDGFLVTLEEAEPALESLLIEIEKMFADTRVTDTILGPVIQAGLDALRCSDRSGKLFIFHTNLPIYEAPGKLKNRDDRKLLGTDKEKNVLQPAIDFYGKLGEECVKAGCGVDIYLFPNSFVDVASIAPVCTVTGGSVYKYQYFEAQKDGERFLHDLGRDISREIVFDVMMRIRTSTGLRPTGFFGSFFMDNSTDMETGTFDCDKAVHVEMRHDDKLPEGSAHIQCAVLFTSCSGQRRLRVHNLSLAVSSDYNQLYRVADHDALVSFLCKQAESMVREKSPKEMREAITARCAQMLATYRERCSEQAPLGQLILPECLKLLPLYGNCIIRNDAVSGGSDCTVDDRAWLMHMVPSLTVEDAMRVLYPVIYPVSDLSLEKPTDELPLPGCIRASFEYFNTEKAYLMCNGIMMFIWIGLGVPQEWVQDVFNANSVTHLNTENHVIPERDNSKSRALRRVMDRMRTSTTRSMKLFVIRQQDALEAWMKRFLVEDQSASMPSYVDYLCTIHKEIRSLLS